MVLNKIKKCVTFVSDTLFVLGVINVLDLV